MEPTTVMTLITGGLAGIEKVTKLYKEWTATLPSGPEKTKAEHAIVEANTAIELAQVKLAEGFGFKLCRRHMPPGVLLDIREDIFPKWKCSTCGDITPKRGPEITVDSSFEV